MRTAAPSRHRLTAIATASVLALSVFGGAASAANSRVVYVGSNLVDAAGAIVDLVDNDTGLPGGDGVPDNARTLLPTAVNAGYSTAVPIQVLNADNQTMAHVVLSFPAPAPVGSPLASTLTITDIGGTDQGACWKVIDPATSAVTGVACNFDNLAARTVRSFFIVVATTVPTSTTNLFSARATTNNENGSNLQIFDATSGSFSVQAANANTLSTFVPPGQAAKTFLTDPVGGSNKLQTKLSFTQSPGGNLVKIAETGTEGGGSTFLYACPTGLTCQAAETTISVQDGLSGSTTDFSASPYLTVTLTALVPKTYNLNKAFVAHYGASASIPDWILYWNDKSTRCGADIAAKLATTDQCFNDASLSKPNADGSQTLVLRVTMEHNGGMRY